jgi:hypothetical protein
MMCKLPRPILLSVLSVNNTFRWHGDIKPQNIIRVRGEFKLADPGEAQIQLSTGGVKAPRAIVVGGTLTYGKFTHYSRLPGSV